MVGPARVGVDGERRCRQQSKAKQSVERCIKWRRERMLRSRRCSWKRLESMSGRCRGYKDTSGRARVKRKDQARDAMDGDGRRGYVRFLDMGGG
jgi:hypothetical protein